MTLPPCELVLANCCDRRFKGSMGASAPKLPRSGLPTRVGGLPERLQGACTGKKGSQLEWGVLVGLARSVQTSSAP